MRNILTNKQVVETVKERVVSLLQRRRGNWEGTMTDLFDAITTSRKRVPELFPGSASSLRRVVDLVVPSIRRLGYSVQFTRTSDHARRRVVSFTRVR